MKASADRAIRASPRTAIVRVDEIVEAPESLSDLTGNEITVEFAKAARLSAKQQAIFHTNGWVFGDSVAVQALTHQPLDADRPALAAASAAGRDPVASLRTKDAQVRFADADVVASGRVVSISLPNGAAGRGQGRRRGAGGALAFAAGTGSEELLSEHAPLWRDASVEVHEVHKGSKPAKHVTVRFPASTDVMWFKAPKLHVGQEGLFMLHTGELAGSQRRGVAAAAIAPSERVFTVLHPADFQPFDEPGGIRNAIAAASGRTTTDDAPSSPTT
jgi:hypothetical protein